MIVFAADHGIVAQNISPFPQEVTQQMVGNFLAGGAAVSVFCQQHNVPLHVVDVGVNTQFPQEFCAAELFSDRKIAQGTQDFSQQAAMTSAQYYEALQAGIDEVDLLHSSGSNLVLFGEMGIGNTTTSACLMSCLTGIDTLECVGPGTGLSPAGIQHKAAIIDQVKKRMTQQHDCQNDLTQLTVEIIAQECGGFEIIAMAGAMLRAAEHNMAFVVDGFICSIAFLIAQEINQQVKDFAIFAHESKETAHKRLLDYLQVKPLLSIGMRLGEGSGAILVLPIIQSATVFMGNMASFDSASVSNK